MTELTVDRLINYKKIKEINHKITPNQFKELNNIIKFYNIKTIGNRLVNIRDFILYGVDKNWAARLRIIQRKLKSNTFSSYSCKIRYGDSWEIMQNIFKEKTRMDKNKFIELYGKELGINKWKERNEKIKSYGLDNMIQRYGEEIGTLKWKSVLSQKIKTMQIRKEIMPYRNGRTMVEYQKRYGINDGYKKWEERNNRQSYRLSLNGYIDRYGVINGTKKWEEYCLTMNKTSIEAFIKKYGKELGTKRYQDHIKNISHLTSIDGFIEKYGEEIGNKKYQNVLLKKIIRWGKRYSKVSQELFWKIYEKINCTECYFAELNSEYVFYTQNKLIRIFEVDFKLGNNIIEFDGFYWHSSEKQKNIDIIRDDFLISKGYNVLRIPEKDYYKNKEEILEQCINFINKQNETRIEY